MGKAAYGCGAALLAVTALAACGGGGPAGPTSYVVQYSLAVTGSLTMDSLKYDNGHGTFVTVAVPANNWSTVFSAPAGGSVQILAWGLGAPGSGAKLKETWTASGFSTQSDSASVSTTSPVAFSISVPRHSF